MTRSPFNRLALECVAGAAAILVAAAPQRFIVEAQGTSGTIVGHVRLTGPAPPSPVIRMGGDPKCGAAAGGKRVTQDFAVRRPLVRPLLPHDVNGRVSAESLDKDLRDFPKVAPL